jgi:heat shock protein HslJ
MSYIPILTLSASLLLSGCTLISQIAQTPTKKPIQKQIKIEKEKTIQNSITNTNSNSNTTVKDKFIEKEKNVQNSIANTNSKSTITDEFNDYELTITEDINNLEGKYTLERGQISFAGARKDILQSTLVIEKLGVNDFGYYYTIKLKGYPTNEYFGIFAKKDGKYVQKVISDNGEVSYYDNIELLHEDRRIKLTINTNQGKRIIIWNKVDFIDDTKALEGAKEIYNQVCKANYCE